MEKTDVVFGTVTNDYGWTKEMTTTLWSKTYTITCVAAAFKGQEILGEQQGQYKNFLEHREAIEDGIVKAIEEYYNTSITDVENTGPVSAKVIPRELVFKRDGHFGMLFDCDWDVDNGLAVCVSKNNRVGPQDIFL